MKMLIGSDIQSLSELARTNFVRTGVGILTVCERRYVETRKQRMASLAGIIGAKEAFFKAMSGLAGVPRYSFYDVMVRHLKNHRPYLSFKGNIASFLKDRSIHVDVGISHSGDYAVAQVLIYWPSASVER